MAAFPYILGSTVSLAYPLTVRYICQTGVSQCIDGTEQRWAANPAMAEFTVTFTEIPNADKIAINNHFASSKGKFDATWTLDHDGFTYTGMRYEQDDIAWEERGDFWSTKLLMRGFCPTFSGAPSTLPALDSGAATQRPWSLGSKFVTEYTDTQAGKRFATAFRGGGLTGMPTTPEMVWNLVFQTASEAEAKNFYTWFVTQNGRNGSFDFTDPTTGTVYHGCRHAIDELIINYADFSRSGFTLAIEKL